MNKPTDKEVEEMSRYYSKPISKFPKPPCIKDKCLCYPICIDKENIECELLKEYIDNLRLHPYSYPDRSVWFKINKTLPKLVRLNFVTISIHQNGKTHKQDECYLNEAFYRKQRVKNRMERLNRYSYL